MKDISLTIPTKNEEEQIIGTIENYKKILKSIYNEKYEIIIVCNNCTDQTPEIVKKYIKKNKGPIKLIIKPKTAGKGEAILIGWAHANAKYLGFVDSDDQFNHEDIKNMLKNLTKNDCTIASKWKHSSFKNVKESIIKKVFAIGWNSLSKILLGLRFKDTQAGAKFLKKEIYDKIDKNFICKGFDFDIELLYKIKKQGYGIKESYTRIKPNKKSTFQSKHIPNMFKNLIKLWLKNTFY